jgi:hypothetical protein
MEEKMVCEDCGGSDDSVVSRECPFVREIYDTHQEAVICDECNYQRCMDI